MRYEAQNTPTGPYARPHRRLILFGLLGVAATVPSGKELPPRPDPHIPQRYLESLRERIPGAQLGYEYELSAANYLANENESGGRIEGAILELAGLNPDVAYAQVYMLLAKTNNGRALSHSERDAIVVLTNWWPDQYEPYYGSNGTTHSRMEIVNQLKRNYPVLRASFEKWERAEPVMTAARGEPR